MNLLRLKQVESIFESALAVDPVLRDVFLQSHCGDDLDLLCEVRSLLDCHHGSTAFLETPAISLDTIYPIAVAAQAELADPMLGHLIASFRIVRRLGTGGMGVVYLAEQRQPRRVVALKLIRPGLASPAVLQRFEHETQVLGRLKHPGIAAIYDAGAAHTPLGLQPYFAMEYVPGRPLLEYARQTSLGVRQTIELLACIADAVQHAHSKGVIHRDLKPGNILVESTDAPEHDATHAAPRRPAQPKILDFGVARMNQPGAHDASIHTSAGAIVGTVPYMSPEQFSTGAADTPDTRTDVYSLGVIAYELLTGRLPLQTQGVPLAAAAQMIVADAPPRPSSIVPTLRGDIEVILLKAIEKDPARRYQTASALADDLRRVLANQPVLARPSSAGYQFRKLIARHKVSAALTAAILVLLIGFGVWMSVLYAHANTLRLDAEREAADALSARAGEEAQRRVAERREVSARRVTRVLIASFRASDPTIFKSRDIDTRRLFAEEILSVGAERARQQLADEPLLQSEIELGIAQIYDNLGLYDDAMALLGHALQTRRRELGPRDPAVAELLFSYGQSAHSSGNAELAYASMHECASIFEEHALTDHPFYSGALSQLGTYALATMRLDEAMAAFERAGLLKSVTKGHANGMYAVTLNGVAGVLHAQGKHPEAEQVLRKAIELAAIDLEPDSGVFASLRNNLAWILYEQGDFEGALDQAAQSLAIRRERFGRDSTKVADSLLVLGIVTAESGRPLDAEPLLRDALRIRLATVPGARGLIGEAQCALASCLSFLQRFEDGEPFIREGIANLRAGHGDAHQDTQRALAGAVHFFTAWNKPDQAAPFAALLKPAPTR